MCFLVSPCCVECWSVDVRFVVLLIVSSPSSSPSSLPSSDGQLYQKNNMSLWLLFFFFLLLFSEEGLNFFLGGGGEGGEDRGEDLWGLLRIIFCAFKSRIFFHWILEFLCFFFWFFLLRDWGLICLFRLQDCTQWPVASGGHRFGQVGRHGQLQIVSWTCGKWSEIRNAWLNHPIEPPDWLN